MLGPSAPNPPEYNTPEDILVPVDIAAHFEKPIEDELNCLVMNITTPKLGFGSGATRLIAGIASGTVKGPGIEGTLVENSGADWAEQVHSKKIYYKLDARYTIKTNDGHHIFVHARGLFRPGPGIEFSQPDSIDVDCTQDEVEYFTHITFEAAGNSPYSWMNGIVAIGALRSFGGAAVIDCCRLTNFLGQHVEDVYVGR